MFAAIQSAYYTEARDPSDHETLVAIATELGLDEADFRTLIDAPETHQRLTDEFALRDQLGASSFPSVGLQRDGEFILLASGWNDAPTLAGILKRAQLL